ncbi:hypothetical protein GOODEAATRI_030228, partial [Goodea atripinnis]
HVKKDIAGSPSQGMKEAGLLDADCEQHTRERRTEREGGGAAREDDGGGSPPSSVPAIYSVCNRASKEKAAGRGGLNGRQDLFSGCSPCLCPHPGSGFSVSPMEPLPSQGQSLRHYTASRPRPRRTHTQPPSSRPQAQSHFVERAQAAERPSSLTEKQPS